MSEYDEVVDKLNTGDAWIGAELAQDAAALLQKYHDALVRLGEDYFTQPVEGEETWKWLDLELTAHKDYANKVLEDE